jgi:20S proteasome subunit alpha 5
MFLTRAGYDRGANTFSPEGRLFQVEYAMEAIKLGTTAIGIKVPEGVILVVEKRLPSKLLIAKSVEKIFEIDAHVACAMSGLTSDAHTLIERARVDAQNHFFTYNESMKIKSIAQSVCDLALQFGEAKDENDAKGKMSRPFGVALLFAGVDADGPQLISTDPSGTFVEYKAKAVGGGAEGAQRNLEETFEDTLSLDAAEDLALSTSRAASPTALHRASVGRTPTPRLLSRDARLAHAPAPLTRRTPPPPSARSFVRSVACCTSPPRPEQRR